MASAGTAPWDEQPGETVTEPIDPRDDDQQRLDQLRAHALHANHVANAGLTGRSGLRGAADRLGRATAPHQAELNVEASAALSLLPEVLQRLTARIDALEANSTEVWSELRGDPSSGTPGAGSYDDTALRALFASHDVLLGELADSIDGVHERLDGLDLAMQRLSDDETAATNARALDRVEGHMQSVRSDVELLRGNLANARAQVETLLHDFRAAPEVVTRTAAEAADVRIADIYSRFEERFRGSRSDVAASLDVYEDDFDRLGAGGPVVDLGPGRGEFLERLGGLGVEAYGIDTNPTFVEQCVARGLDVRLGDALEHLSTVPEGTLGAVTGFHIVEHLPIPTLVELLDRALLALAPGGRILFETPNPTNLIVGASSFYLDPTHLRPLHPDLLAFLASDRGFVNVEIRHLRPSRPDLVDQLDELDETEKMLRWSVFGPQDVAVLATAPGRPTD